MPNRVTTDYNNSLLFPKNYKLTEKDSFKWSGYFPYSGSKAEYYLDILPIVLENKQHRNSLKEILEKCKSQFSKCTIVNPVDLAIAKKLFLYPSTHQLTLRVKYDDLRFKYIFFSVLSFKRFNCEPRQCVHILGNWLLLNMDKYKYEYLLTPTPDNIEWYYLLILARMKHLT